MVVLVQREDGPATAMPDKRTHLRIKRRADASHVAPPVFSVVAPVYNEEETLPHFYRRVVDVMERLGEPFELVLVNDGSRDGSYRVMPEPHACDPRARPLDFWRNLAHQVAISAALDHSRGAAVISPDSDLHHPPDLTPALVP